MLSIQLWIANPIPVKWKHYFDSHNFLFVLLPLLCGRCAALVFAHYRAYGFIFKVSEFNVISGATHYIYGTFLLFYLPLFYVRWGFSQESTTCKTISIKIEYAEMSPDRLSQLTSILWWKGKFSMTNYVHICTTLKLIMPWQYWIFGLKNLSKIVRQFEVYIFEITVHSHSQSI